MIRALEPAAVHSNRGIYVHENEETKRTEQQQQQNYIRRKKATPFTTQRTKIVKTIATNKNGKMEIVFRFVEAKDALNV